MTDLNKLTMAEARDGLRKKDFSATELTQAFLAAIEAANPALNAYVLPTPELALAGNLMNAVIGWLYHAISESSPWMATLGKKTAGIVVTDLHGHRISFGRATGRNLGKILSALPCLLGFFRIPFTEKRQGWHDELARCLVIRAGALPSFDVSQTFE